MSENKFKRFTCLSPSVCCLVTLLSLGFMLNVSCAEPGSPETLPDVILDRPSGEDMVPDHIVVKLRDAQGTAATLPAQDVEPLGLDTTPIRRTSGGELVYGLSEEASSKFKTAAEKKARLLEIVRTLQSRPDVEYAQPDWFMQPYAQ